jgi:threonylcarbamoyladenosine tRNA methylthiotransferase MtaB
MCKRLTVVTVGCKANFADSAAIVEKAHRAGFEIVPPRGPADVLVVNGCTVTHRADRDSRALARRARRENPEAVVVMTGCYAEVAGENRDAVPEVDHWVGIREPSEMEELLRRLGGNRPSRADALSEYHAHRMLGRHRAFLKVQDGCDASCAYCIVPKTRGPSRSLPRSEVVGRAVRAEEEGAKELVLTGIHVGRYGADRGERDGLSVLVETLLAATSECRFRLGSVEPLEITAQLAGLLAAEPRLCPHLHVPLQSGSDRVLQRMRRPYTARQYRARLEMLHGEIPGIRLGADVIAGFPGETVDDFGDTMRLVGDSPLSYLHAFPYSRREGTESAGWADDISAAEKKARVAALRDSDEAMQGRYLGRQIGKILTVVTEADAGAGGFLGTSENYAEVLFSSSRARPGDLVPVRVRAVQGALLTGGAVVEGDGD